MNRIKFGDILDLFLIEIKEFFKNSSKITVSLEELSKLHQIKKFLWNFEFLTKFMMILLNLKCKIRKIVLLLIYY